MFHITSYLSLIMSSHSHYFSLLVNEMRIKAVGCGYTGCESTMEDALYELSGPILCYKGRSTKATVKMTQGCETHEDTKLTTLVFNALSSVANHYYKECKTLMSRSITLPHTTLLNGPNQTSTFPCTVDQALALYPWVQTRCAELLVSLLDGRHFSLQRV